jgi:hypothetical protein
MGEIACCPDAPYMVPQNGVYLRCIWEKSESFSYFQVRKIAIFLATICGGAMQIFVIWFSKRDIELDPKRR